ncbi:ABC transporter ATP-binding protein [Microbaculum marinum]|uniref:ABC transporter ATP-binding protein n=1 Tax=Microbaculum marinum TaxID=1764581 RepID=A0AAW9S2V3_9HYPH
MADPLLRVEALAKSFGALKATDDLTLEVADGEIHALIGPNGAGKTTLVNQLSGELKPDHGRVLFDGHDITTLPVHERPHLGLVRSFQITSIFPDFTVLENVALSAQSRTGHSFHFFAPVRRDRVLNRIAGEALAAVGMKAEADRPAHALSHGQQRRLELAMALVLKPRLLLLDEPMAGMGPDESAFVVDVLRGLRGEVTMLLIEHDMDAVFALADRITVLVYGSAIATGTPAEIRENPAVREAYLGEEEPA